MPAVTNEVNAYPMVQSISGQARSFKVAVNDAIMTLHVWFPISCPLWPYCCLVPFPRHSYFISICDL